MQLHQELQISRLLFDRNPISLLELLANKIVQLTNLFLGYFLGIVHNAVPSVERYD